MAEKLLVFPVVTVRCVLFFSTMDDLVIRKKPNIFYHLAGSP